MQLLLRLCTNACIIRSGVKFMKNPYHHVYLLNLLYSKVNELLSEVLAKRVKFFSLCTVLLSRYIFIRYVISITEKCTHVSHAQIDTLPLYIEDLIYDMFFRR